MMKDQIDILIKLQAIESEAAKIRAALDEVPEKISALENERQDFEKTITEKSSLIDELTKKYRSCEADARMTQSRIDKSREKLRSVKTNKEYQSSLKEIEDLKARNSQLEDEMLECLDQIDDAEKALADMKSEFQHFSRELDEKISEIKQEAVDREARLAQLDIEEKEISKTVNPEMLSVFLTVKKKQAQGLAIVRVSDAKCHGCHVSLPPQMYNELQRCDKLQFCPNCQRIIYWKQD